MQSLSQTNGTSGVVEEKAVNGHINAIGAASASSPQHFGDWPNEAGFNASQEQRAPIELKVTGTIPPYAAGVLYRTGPGHYKVPGAKNGDFEVSHWFDGFTHVHRFQILPQPDGTTKVIYNSRLQVDKLLEQARKTRNLGAITFGQKRDPCDGFFKKFKSVFDPGNTVDPYLDNTGVTLALNTPGFHQANAKPALVVTTDANRIKTIDPDTLEPLGCTSQISLHPSLKGPLAAAHAERDPITGDIFNYNLAFGATEIYRIFHTSASTGQTRILATLSGAAIRGAYIHSLFLTTDFVILCLWPAFFAAKGAKILWERSLMGSLAYDPAAATRWLVVDRSHAARGLVASFTSPAMFAFHTVNAWQTPAGAGTDAGAASSTASNTSPPAAAAAPGAAVDIVCELVQYANMDILDNFYYKNLTSTAAGTPSFRGSKTDPTAAHDINTYLARYRLPSVPLATTPASPSTAQPAQTLFVLPRGLCGDLPTINPTRHTRPHRFVYSVLTRGRSSFLEAICKTDTAAGAQATAVYWECARHTPGEPVFVRRLERRLGGVGLGGGVAGVADVAGGGGSVASGGSGGLPEVKREVQAGREVNGDVEVGVGGGGREGGREREGDVPLRGDDGHAGAGSRSRSGQGSGAEDQDADAGHVRASHDEHMHENRQKHELEHEDNDEDDGVLLSVVLDGDSGRSYLLCLDARTLAELGRAECPHAVGFGFHGKHYPA